MDSTRHSTSPRNRRLLASLIGLVAALPTFPSFGHAQESSSEEVRSQIDARRRAMREAASQASQQPASLLAEEETIDFACPRRVGSFLRDEISYTPTPRLPFDEFGCRATVNATAGFWERSGSGANDPPALRGRIIRTDDRGITWLASDSGLPAPRFIAQSANGPIAAEWPVVQDMTISVQDPNIIYVGTRVVQSVPVTPQVGNGLFKSINGGQSWTAINSGLPRQGDSPATVWDTSHLLLHPHNDQHVLAVLADTSTMQLYATTDGGLNWNHVQLGDLPSSEIQRLFLLGGTEPTRASVLMKDKSKHECESLDFGLTWTVVSN